MPEKDLKSCIHQWEHRKKLEKINLMIQKIGQKKDNEESNELKIKSFQIYKYGTKKH